MRLDIQKSNTASNTALPYLFNWKVSTFGVLCMGNRFWSGTFWWHELSLISSILLVSTKSCLWMENYGVNCEALFSLFSKFLPVEIFPYLLFQKAASFTLLETSFFSFQGLPIYKGCQFCFSEHVHTQPPFRRGTRHLQP